VAADRRVNYWGACYGPAQSCARVGDFQRVRSRAPGSGSTRGRGLRWSDRIDHAEDAGERHGSPCAYNDCSGGRRLNNTMRSGFMTWDSPRTSWSCTVAFTTKDGKAIKAYGLLGFHPTAA